MDFDPEMFKVILENPLIRAAVSDPAKMEALINKNPQLKMLCEIDPSLK